MKGLRLGLCVQIMSLPEAVLLHHILLVWNVLESVGLLRHVEFSVLAHVA